MGWMAGVLDDPPGFPYTPPGVDVLEEGSSPPTCGGQFARPFAELYGCQRCCFQTGGDAAGQDALHSAGVEGSEDAGAHSKLLSRLRKKRR